MFFKWMSVEFNQLINSCPNTWRRRRWWWSLPIKDHVRGVFLFCNWAAEEGINRYGNGDRQLAVRSKLSLQLQIIHQNSYSVADDNREGLRQLLSYWSLWSCAANANCPLSPIYNFLLILTTSSSSQWNSAVNPPSYCITMREIMQ